MARPRVNRPERPSESSDQMPIRVKEKGNPVRIRAGAGINFTHVDGKYLGSGVFEIDQIEKGTGSKSGWGHLANGAGWVALDFVEIVKESK